MKSLWNGEKGKIRFIDFLIPDDFPFLAESVSI